MSTTPPPPSSSGTPPSAPTPGGGGPPQIHPMGGFVPPAAGRHHIFGEGGFNNIGFAVGEVRGMRSFVVKEDGHLYGVTFPQRWVPGVNDALCYRNLASKRVMDDDIREQALAKPPHPLRSCGCGFWAFWGDLDTYQRSAWSLTGVVSGWGRVIIGTRGFRATRARILALSFDQQGGGRVGDYATHPSATNPSPSKKTTAPWMTDDLIERIVENYPGVAFYDTYPEMIEHHPTKMLVDVEFDHGPNEPDEPEEASDD